MLIVEDNKFNREAVVLMLGKLGVDYETASNGQEGADKVEEYMKAGKMFDIVLMDLIMPMSDGYEGTNLIRKLEKEFKIPDTNRLFICGYSSHVNRGKYLQTIPNLCIKI